MKKAILAKIKNKQVPIIIEKEDKFYIVECPVFSGCFTQGKTIEEALENIREVIELCLEEKYNQDALENYNPQELSFHNITI